MAGGRSSPLLPCPRRRESSQICCFPLASSSGAAQEPPRAGQSQLPPTGRMSAGPAAALRSAVASGTLVLRFPHCFWNPWV